MATVDFKVDIWTTVESGIHWVKRSRVGASSFSHFSNSASYLVMAVSMCGVPEEVVGP